MEASTSSVAGSASGKEGSSKDKDKDHHELKKIPQRASRSCVECSRRKARCDKVVPCTPCQKRGRAHLCRIDTSKPGEHSISEVLADPEASETPEVLRKAALGEFELFRDTFDTLKSRLGGLESLMAKAFIAAEEGGVPGGGGGLPHKNPMSGKAQGMEFGDERQARGYARSRLEAHTKRLRESQSTSRERTGSVEPRGDREGQHGDDREAVEASLQLEFMALGRRRAFGEGNRDDLPSSPNSGMPTPPGNMAANSDVLLYDSLSPLVPHPHTLLPSPSSKFPTAASIEAVAPNKLQTELLLGHCLDYLGWHHCVVHVPTFKDELKLFWARGDRGYEDSSPAWLALYFALLVVGVKSLTRAQRDTLAMSDATAAGAAKQWFDCCLSSLYRANFLENHSIYALQAISVLALSGRDAWSSNIIATLLTTGLGICQDIGLHRMVPDEVWNSSMAMEPPAIRTRALINREVQKRVFWGLAHQDWFSIPYRRTYSLRPSQINTPLPLNVTDEDLVAGLSVSRPISEFTNAAWLNGYIEIAKHLQSIFEHIDSSSHPSYQFLLKVDSQLERFLANVPPWLIEGGPTTGMPPCAAWIRGTFLISSNHKVMTLHRPFLHMAFKDERYRYSRQRSISAARTILREGVKIGECRIWTTLYHISAAAFVICLDLFQQVEYSSQTIDDERREVQQALAALEKRQGASEIVERGVTLITKLLSEEAKLRHEKQTQRHIAGLPARAAKPITSLPVTDTPGKKPGALISDLDGDSALAFDPTKFDGPPPPPGFGSPELFPPVSFVDTMPIAQFFPPIPNLESDMFNFGAGMGFDPTSLTPEILAILNSGTIDDSYYAIGNSGINLNLNLGATGSGESTPMGNGMGMSGQALTPLGLDNMQIFQEQYSGDYGPYNTESTGWTPLAPPQSSNRMDDSSY